MLASFSGLELAKRALQAQQMAIDVTGQNIANAGTQGYTRQVVNLQATQPDKVMSLGRYLEVGSGVTVNSITRAKDNFVAQQLQSENSQQQYWATQQDNLSKVQTLLNEPSDNGLSNSLDQFWNAWSELGNNPQDLATRAVILEKSQTLVANLHYLSNQTTQLQNSLDGDVRMQIQQINDYAGQIGQLNNQIKQAEVQGASPNDLYDKRDALVNQLAQLVNVKVIESRDPHFPDKQVNSFNLAIGDTSANPPQYIVNDGSVHLLQAADVSQSGTKPFATVTWADGHNAGSPDQWGNTVQLGDSGALIANIKARGDQQGAQGYLADFQTQLDTLASGLANAVNSLHQNGYDLNGNPGEEFFVSGVSGTSTITANNITVNQDIAGDPKKIAAAASPGTNPGDNSGDGSVALNISSLADGWQALSNVGVVPGTSLGAYYASIVSKIGLDTQQASQMSDMHGAVASQLQNQQDSASGVSLDEEMINLSKFQKTYTAAARVVTVMDDMYDTLVNGMGVTR